MPPSSARRPTSCLRQAIPRRRAKVARRALIALAATAVLAVGPVASGAADDEPYTFEDDFESGDLGGWSRTVGSPEIVTRAEHPPGGSPSEDAPRPPDASGAPQEPAAAAPAATDTPGAAPDAPPPSSVEPPSVDGGSPSAPDDPPSEGPTAPTDGSTDSGSGSELASPPDGEDVPDEGDPDVGGTDETPGEPENRLLVTPVNSSYNYVTREFPAAGSVEMEFDYRLEGKSHQTLLRMQDNDVSLRNSASGRLMVRLPGEDWKSVGSFAAGKNEWNRVRLELDVEDGQVIVFANGERQADLRANLVPETRVLFGDLTQGGGGPYTFDDVSLETTTFDPAGDQTGFFSRDSLWRTPVDSDAGVDPDSDELVAGLVREVGEERHAMYGPGINSTSYSTPVYTVPVDQARVPVKIDTSTPSNLQGAFSSVPIPPEAKPAGGNDRHMVIWQPATDTYWEMWRAERRSDGWHASWGAATREASKNKGYFEQGSWPGAADYWGATSSKLTLAGGLMRTEELANGRIDHALALGLPGLRANTLAAPARRSDGRLPDTDSLPMGARLRIDPDLDLDTLDLPPAVRTMAEAAQRHGMVVHDTSGAVAVYAEDPAQTGSNPYPELLGSDYPKNLYRLMGRFPWKHLQVMRMDVSTRQADIPADRDGPTVRLTEPWSSTVSGKQVFRTYAMDRSGISRVEFLVDGVVRSTDTAVPWTLGGDGGRWDTAKESNGSHVLSVRAVDRVGNSKTQAKTVKVANP